MLKIFGPSLEKSKIRAAKEKCAGDTQYRRAHFDAGCVDFGESDDVENIFNTLLERAGCFRGTTSTLALANEEGTSVFGRVRWSVASSK